MTRAVDPSRARVMAILPRLVVLGFLAGTGADPDLFGHLTFGREIVHAFAVHRSDPYSFTSDIAWVNHEWLAESVMWIAYAAGGAPGLVALKLLLATIAGALMLATWKPYELRFVPREGLLFAIALAAWPQFVSARPQMFSLAMFAWLLYELERFRRGADRTLWRLPLLFALWVNLHGGWLVGAGVLVIFTAAVLVDRAYEVRRRGRLLAAGVASAAATLVNPYGPAMLGFLAGTVRPERADILEWSPITALPPVIMVLVLVPIAMGVGAAWRGGRAVPRSSLAICVLLGIGALRVARLVGFCGIAVGFLLAPFLLAPGGEVSSGNDGARRSRTWLTDVSIALGSIAIAVALLGRTITMDGEWLPEPEAVPAIKAHHLRGRMLTWFNYGEYAIWHLWPEIKVSNDGRRETVYSDKVRQVHSLIYADKPGAIDAFATMNPDHVWLPVESPMIERLQKGGWRTVFKGPLSVVLTRTEAGQPTLSRRGTSTSRAFPGP